MFVAAIIVSPGILARAQTPKPKPRNEAKPQESAEARDKANDDAASKAEKDLPMPADPAAAAILETKPSTPAECVRAAKILSDLRQPDLARRFLQKVIDAKLDSAGLANLAEQSGSAAFVELGARADLHPQSQQLADAVLGAQNAALQNPERIAGLIKQLQDPSAEKRGAAFSGLMPARGAAVAAMIETLADPALAAEHPAIRSALAAMGRQAANPLLGIMDQADAELKVQVVATLGAMNDQGLQLFLFQPYFSPSSDPRVRAAAGAALKKLGGALPTKEQAVGLLVVNSKKYFDRRQGVPVVADGKAEVWRWDEAQGKCVIERIPADDAGRDLAARLARYAFDVAPENSEAKQLHIVTMLEAAAYQKGLATPPQADDAVMTEAKKSGAKAVEAAMAYAMAGGHTAAAAAAAGILDQIGTAEEMLYAGPKPSPLALALQSPDRRLRIAAARAIVLLKPKRPFAGSSYLLQTLEFFASSSGMRRALLAGANVEGLRKMASALNAAGFQSDTATNGREAMLMAASSPDYELAWIDVGIDQPPINLLLQQLRHDDRSADLRVGLIAREGFAERAQHAAEHDPMAKAFARPHEDASVAWQLQQLAEIRPDEFVGFDERQRQAGEALDMLAELGRNPGKLYDIRQAEKAVLTALGTPSLSKKAVAVLAMINSPEAQRALVEMASHGGPTPDVREAAAAALRENLQAHGILLTSEEIKTQYQRYDEAKNGDESTKKILGLILECLEAPAKTKK